MKIFRNLIIIFCTYTLFSVDGSAFSIHMATLKYEKCRKEGNLLFLSGISIGNHQNISFTDTLTVEKLTQDSLILKRGK